jgi:hypothetical protein
MIVKDCKFEKQKTSVNTTSQSHRYELNIRSLDSMIYLGIEFQKSPYLVYID